MKETKFDWSDQTNHTKQMSILVLKNVNNWKKKKKKGIFNVTIFDISLWYFNRVHSFTPCVHQTQAGVLGRVWRQAFCLHKETVTRDALSDGYVLHKTSTPALSGLLKLI